MGRTGTLVDRWLTMHCTLQARVVGATNADNRPVVAYDDPVEDVPCRLMEIDEKLIVSPAQAGMVGYDKRLIVPASVARIPLDQVSAVARPDPGDPETFVVFDQGPYIVRRVLDRADQSVQFKTALLSRVGGAR